MSRTIKNNSRILMLLSTAVVRIIAEDHARQPHLGRNIIAPSLMSYGSLIAKLSKSASSDDDNLHRNNTTNEADLDVNPEFLLPLSTRDIGYRNQPVTISSRCCHGRGRAARTGSAELAAQLPSDYVAHVSGLSNMLVEITPQFFLSNRRWMFLYGGERG